MLSDFVAYKLKRRGKLLLVRNERHSRSARQDAEEFTDDQSSLRDGKRNAQAVMNQQCKVCGEPAAGFHFGAFTCEGCKSFFGRSYNNLSSISECKNNGECVINKKNRTSCKACRLRKCLLVGMSKSGSRYGRRSNWFKIHCLLQEQQQQQQQQQQQHNHHHHHQPQQQHLHQVRQKSPPLGLLGHQHALHHQLAAAAALSHHHRTKEDLMLLGLDEYKTAASPSVSSPESHNSDSSVEVGDQRLASPAKDLFVPLPFASLAGVGVFPHAFLPAAAPFLFPTHGGYLYPPKHHLLKAPQPQTLNNNNVEPSSKRFYLDAILKSQQLSEDESSRLTAEDDGGRSTTSPLPPPLSLAAAAAEQDNPMDLSMKGCRIRHHDGSSCTPPRESPRSDLDDVDSDREDDDADVDHDDEEDDALAHGRRMAALAEHRATPMDLTTRA